MSISKDIWGELTKMFVSDARVTGFILALVAVTAALCFGTDLPPLFAGAFLLCGSLSILVLGVRAEARRRLAAKGRAPDKI